MALLCCYIFLVQLIRVLPGGSVASEVVAWIRLEIGIHKSGNTKIRGLVQLGFPTKHFRIGCEINCFETKQVQKVFCEIRFVCMRN
jgi:hypothetical protein